MKCYLVTGIPEPTQDGSAIYGFRLSALADAPWTAGADNWYILTSLTESLYLERFTGCRLMPSPKGVALVVWLRIRTILAGSTACIAIQRINDT